MYKLLIVDDEQIEREGMAQFIPWEKYDIELLDTAWNGVDALEKIQKETPDIVLTDIKMPIMNGIELIERLANTYKDIVVIVLSGYGEYEFTSQAMEYGVRHYVLKPCDEDKIISVIDHAKEEVDSRREKQLKEKEYHTIKRELLPHAKEELFRRAIKGNHLSEKEMKVLREDLPEKGERLRLVAMKNNITGFEYIEQFILGNILGEILKMPSVPLFTSVDDMVFFAIDADSDTKLTDAVKKTLNEFARMKTKSIESAASRVSDITQADILYKQIIYLFALGDKSENAGLLCYPEEESENTGYYFDFDNLKKAQRFDEILFEVTLAMKKMQSRGLSDDKKQKNFEAFIVTWSSYVGNDKANGFKISDISSQDIAIADVSKWLAETLNLYLTGKESERMEKILSVVYCNIDNTELNIQYIAKNILYMNEDYFGRVFSRNVQVKFSTYLEQCRIEMAKRLLQYNPDMKIATLTELIGYPVDGQYFSKIFRKICNQTPTEYRESLKNK